MCGVRVGGGGEGTCSRSQGFLEIELRHLGQGFSDQDSQAGEEPYPSQDANMLEAVQGKLNRFGILHSPLPFPGQILLSASVF